MTTHPVAILLAAGLGTRMRSSLAKVLHPLCGRPMLAWGVEACIQAGLEPSLVLHHQEGAVRAALPGVPAVRQEHPRGTGDAVRAAIPLFPATGIVVVLPGDAPLIRPSILTALVEAHGDALCTVLSTRVAEPAEYGRIVRDGQGRAAEIVEAAECTPAQRAIDEVNTGIYAFDAAWLRDEVLPLLQPHPPKDEFYLTDAVAAAARLGRLRAICHADAPSLAGINDRWALAQAEEILQERILRAHGEAGVTLVRPGSLRIEVSVLIAPDVVIEPGTILEGDTRIAAGCRIGAHTVLRDTTVGAGSQVLPGTIAEGAFIGERCRIGPMSRLRPGTRIEADCHVGNFVETKNCHMESGAKANHLTYLGDVEVGARTNVGAGTITCNYDGYRKHRTLIGEDVFIGSNTALVAPVSLGDGSLVGAGSVITRDVPPNALAVARGDQRVHEEGGRRLRRKLADDLAREKSGRSK